MRVQSKDVARLASKRVAAMAGTVKMPEGVTAEKMGKDVFNSTYYPRGEDTDNSRKPWIVIDAAGLRLGRLSTLVATYLRGGNVATYSPSMNMGTYVVIVNAEQVVVSGNKFEDKLYKRHTTGRPGAMKQETFRALQGRIPERIIEKAVRGMLPEPPRPGALHAAQGVRRIGAPARLAEPGGCHRGGQGEVLLFFHAAGVRGTRTGERRSCIPSRGCALDPPRRCT